jgi:hypothetical protein
MYFEHSVLFLSMFLIIIKLIDMPEMHAKEAVAATNWKVKKWNGSVSRGLPTHRRSCQRHAMLSFWTKQSYHPTEEGIDM